MESAFGCINNTIRTASGLYFDFADPRPEHIRLEDIATGLSNICRFGGQIARFYSVAEHCIACATLCLDEGHGNEAAKHVLLHDAAEAYTGDIVKPLKIMLPDFAVIEQRVEAAIAQRFGLLDHWDSVIKLYDRQLLMDEKRATHPQDATCWFGEEKVPVRDYRPRYNTPFQARGRFLNLADHLGIN